MLVHVNASPLTLLPIHSQHLLSAPPFLPPQMLSHPFTILPYPCWLLSLSTALPSAPAASHAHVLTCFCPMTKPHHLQTQVVQKIWWDLRTLGLLSLEGKMQNLLVLVPLYMVLGAPLVWLYWEVIPRRNILQFLMGMKANCNLQLNSGFCF